MNSEQNNDKITAMLTNNTPCHILLYIVGYVIIGAGEFSDFPIEEFLYRTALSWLYVN